MMVSTCHVTGRWTVWLIGLSRLLLSILVISPEIRMTVFLCLFRVYFFLIFWIALVPKLWLPVYIYIYKSNDVMRWPETIYWLISAIGFRYREGFKQRRSYKVYATWWKTYSTRLISNDLNKEINLYSFFDKHNLKMTCFKSLREREREIKMKVKRTGKFQVRIVLRGQNPSSSCAMS